jgi:aerobic carbon-monoxide dehydrogenase medium subunit
MLDADGGWQIAANAPLQAVYAWDACPEVLHWSLSGALTWQERNETTVGRALKSVSLAPVFVAALLALRASVTDGDKEVPLPQYLGEPSLLSGPVGVKVAPADGARTCGKASVARTPADRPIVAAVACVSVRDGKVTEAEIALTGVWQQPVGVAAAGALLLGKPLTEESIAQVAAAVEAEVRPNSNFLGSEEYRRAMSGVLARRALTECLKGAAA